MSFPSSGDLPDPRILCLLQSPGKPEVVTHGSILYTLEPFFKKIIFIYLFLAVLGLCCRAGFSLAAASGGHSLAAVRWLLPVVLLLWSLGSRLVGSVAAAPGHSCSEASEIFPDQGLNLCLLHWQVGSLPLSHQESP